MTKTLQEIPRAQGGLDDLMVEVETRGLLMPADLQKLIEMGARHGHAFIGPPLEA